MSQNLVLSKAELLDNIRQGWDEFQAYLATLTPQQLTEPTDPAGWTAKDHIMHLAVWENGVAALLDRHDRFAAMGVDKATWDSGNFDRINGVIQDQTHALPLDEVLKEFASVHQRLVAKIETLSDEDLRRPAYSYQTKSTDRSPVINRIIGNTYSHYAEHRPWIAAIVANA